MISKVYLGALVLAAPWSLMGCGEGCLLASCGNTLNVSIQLPGEPNTYSFAFVTDQGQTSCEIEVPVVLGRDCEDSSLVRFAPKEGTDGTVADVYILDSVSANIIVTRGDEELHVGTVTAEPGSRVQEEGSEDYCGGPCYSTTASLDLSGIAP